MSILRLVPLVLLLAPLSAPAQELQRIEVDLTNFKFTPGTVPLVHGRRYLLHLVNKAGGGHSFAARAFFAAAAVAPEDRGKLADGKIEMKGGETVDVHFTALAPGSYAIKCTHALHAAFGMTGKFVVT